MSFVDSRVLAAQELTRLAAAIAGTYVVPTASGGAVSTSAAMTVAVAAITTTTGLYVNAVQDTTGYAGGTTVIATADPTNPRRDYVWYDGAGAIGNTTGTPAANPVLPDLTTGRIALAEIYVTAGLATIASGNIIDRRANQATPSPFALVAQSSTPTTTTSTTAVDLVTLAGLSIANTSFIRIDFQYRKTASAAQAIAFGLKTNLGVHYQAQVAAGTPQSSANNAAEAGYATIIIPPRITNYTISPLAGFYSCNSSAGSAASGANGLLAVGTQNWTTGTVTSIILQAINGTSNNNAEIAWVKVYTY